MNYANDHMDDAMLLAAPPGGEAAKSRARAALVERFGIESEFVRVSVLSKIVGLAQPTIYASMRRGDFFIPHRLLNSAPAVKLDDLVEWYCGPGTQPAPVQPSAPTRPPRAAHPKVRKAESGPAKRPSNPWEREGSKKFVAEVLAAMDADTRQRRSTRNS